MKTCTHSNNKKRGFTLPEILVVVAVVGIIAILVVPAVADAKIDSQQSKQEAVMASVAMAKMRFDLDPETTTTQRMIFNQGTNTERMNLIKKYMAVNGEEPVMTDLTSGTGFAYFRIKNLSETSQFSNQDEIVRISGRVR